MLTSLFFLLSHGQPLFPSCSADPPLSVAGKWSTASGATSEGTCQKCLAGTYVEVEGSDSASDCRACSSGTFSTVVGATSSSSCQQCPAGKYKAVAGAGACDSCPPGEREYADARNAA